MLIGRLENPKLRCLRELHHVGSECEAIPLGVKKNVSQQKFRIPFKNTSTSHDGDFDFTFVKTSSHTSDSQSDIDLEDLTPLFEFCCQPGNMKIAANQQQFLNVLIKVNLVKMNELEATKSKAKMRKILSRPISKLLIARLKDTGVLYSFFVTINLIN